MSDIQDYSVTSPHSKQQHIQQRQILAMMGVEPWIQTKSATLNIASIQMPVVSATPSLIVLSPPPIITLDQALLSDTDMNNTDADIDTDPNPNDMDITGHDLQKTAKNKTTDNLSITRQISRNSTQVANKQHQMQQRQILAMMGIEPWVQLKSVTLKMADIEPVTHPTPMHVQDTDHIQNCLVTNSLVTDNLVQKALQSNIDTHINPVNDALPVIENIDIQAIQTTQDMPLTSDNKSLNEPLIQADLPDKVAPFDLQGGRYGNWVLIIDMKALNHDSQQLWQNMTQALSLTCETLSFPICRGEDDRYLATASLAGYIFRLGGMSEVVNVAALTALPDGLTHSNLVRTPTLDEMLTDGCLKHQLWEQFI